MNINWINSKLFQTILSQQKKHEKKWMTAKQSQGAKYRCCCKSITHGWWYSKPYPSRKSPPPVSGGALSLVDKDAREILFAVIVDPVVNKPKYNSSYRENRTVGKKNVRTRWQLFSTISFWKTDFVCPGRLRKFFYENLARFTFSGKFLVCEFFLPFSCNEKSYKKFFLGNDTASTSKNQLILILGSK